MALVFSGVWNNSNKPLIQKLNQLAEHAQSQFDIEISVTKMLTETSYRQLVISELTQLANNNINEIICWLTHDTKINNTQEKNTQLSEIAVTGKPSYTLAFSFIFLLFASTFYWFNTTNETNLLIEKNGSTIEKISIATPNLVGKTTLASKDRKDNEVKQAHQTVDTVFRLHGSNTIGEKLAPMLLEGFLTEQGVSNYYWTKKAPLERVLHYRIGDKNYAIELNSHGSSTAFSSLKDGAADIGMSSRRIKNSEVNLLADSQGNLNKLGNEHIIGLDGLAIIVNQNNPLKQLTSDTLAKIFSGEVNNWSQIGGVSKSIKLYARDEHSGTWDTFKNLVLKKNNKKLSKQAIRLESSSELSTLVSQNEDAIGFIGLNYVLHNKAVAISESKETSAIFPTRFTVGTEDYALSRRLYFYTPTSASSVIKNFAQYALSKTGQEIVADAGLISQNIKLDNIYPLPTAPKQYQDYAKVAKRLSLNFRFDYATKDLDNKGQRDLQRLVSFMEEHQSKRIVLMGFSDSIGAVARNTSLSLNRAKSVELALTSRGIPVLAVEGLGEALPIANNNTEYGRKRNRRVEVWLL